MLKVVDEDKKTLLENMAESLEQMHLVNEKVIWAKPGDKADPSKVPEVQWMFLMLQILMKKGLLLPTQAHSILIPAVLFLIDPPSEIGMETFGGTTMFYFRQTPTDRDIQAAAGRT